NLIRPHAQDRPTSSDLFSLPLIQSILTAHETFLSSLSLLSSNTEPAQTAHVHLNPLFVCSANGVIRSFILLSPINSASARLFTALLSLSTSSPIRPARIMAIYESVGMTGILRPS
ncbi:unnamed protein product, partial [Protopolystoma xenopodis]